MAVDLAPYRIRVNAVAPGVVYTGMTAGMASNDALMGAMRETYLLKDPGSRSTSPTACCSWPPTKRGT